MVTPPNNLSHRADPSDSATDVRGLMAQSALFSTARHGRSPHGAPELPLELTKSHRETPVPTNGVALYKGVASLYSRGRVDRPSLAHHLLRLDLPPLRPLPVLQRMSKEAVMCMWSVMTPKQPLSFAHSCPIVCAAAGIQVQSVVAVLATHQHILDGVGRPPRTPTGW